MRSRIPDWSAQQRKDSRAGDTFTGEMVVSVLDSDNSVLVPRGAMVGRVVDVLHRREHLKGGSLVMVQFEILN